MHTPTHHQRMNKHWYVNRMEYCLITQEERKPAVVCNIGELTLSETRLAWKDH